MKHDGISVTAIIVLAAFAIDRGTAGMLALLSFLPGWRASFPDPETCQEPSKRAGAARRNQLMRFVLASVLAILSLSLIPDLRVLEALGMQSPGGILDFVLTWLILVAGSDRLNALVGSGGGDEPKPAAPPANSFQIVGDVRILEEATGKTVTNVR